MEKTAIASTDLNISKLGLGTVKFGRNQGIKYPQGFELPTDNALVDLLSLAKSFGINTLDTAPSYGSSEKRLGQLLKNQRNDWVIVGKAGEEFEDGESTYIFTPDHFEMSLERSLKRLNTNYIDALLIHSDGSDMDILQNDSLIRKMHDFKDQGLVKAIGASTKTAQGGIKTLELMDIVMAMYTQEYTDEKPVLDYAQQNNKTVILKKVLSSGHNTNVNDAFKFAFGHAGINSAIVGTINPQHLKQNVQALKNALL
ncbi:MAG: aldo/keto reductase [Alphaproteobacteria bacterium]